VLSVAYTRDRFCWSLEGIWIMTLETALGLSFALFIFCLLPGPGVLAVTARSLASGFRPAMGLALGMTAGDLFYAAVAMLGLAAIGRILGEFFLLVKMAGVGYLIWMGCKLILKPAESLQEVKTGNAVSLGRNFLVGFAICLGNPKVVLFYLGFLPVFLDLDRLTLTEGFLVMTMVTFVISGTLFVYALAAARLRQFFRSRKAMRRLNRVAGVIP
jgi:threonine/homoserine/homoserine lactone efflux protein